MSVKCFWGIARQTAQGVGDNVEYADYTKLIEPIRHRMVGSIWKIVRDPDDTDDVLQDAMVEIARKIPAVRRHPNPTALILRMCINLAIDFRRRTGRRKSDGSRPIETFEARGPNPSEQLILRERRSRALEAIQRLPAREAESIVLLAVEGFTYGEVAQAMGCRESTARVLVMKARRRLRKMLSDDDAGAFSKMIETEA